MSNLAKRLLTALVGIPFLYFVIKLGGIIFLIFITILAIVAELEFFKLLESKNIQLQKYTILIFTFILVISSSFGYPIFAFALTIILIVFFILELRKKRMDDYIDRIGLSLFSIIYFGWFLSHAILLRNIDNLSEINKYTESVQGQLDIGFVALVFVFACTFLNDTGAYFFGKLFGKRKLISRISPGKTKEGTIAGLILAVITALVVNYLFNYPINYIQAIAFGLLIGVTALFGDLVESSIKRGVGVKDSGGILPGHGGVLDRFDSLIFVFPVSFYFILIYYLVVGVKVF